jgi:hypothetical protein
MGSENVQSKAVALYLGAGAGLHPTVDEAGVLRVFGEVDGRDMLEYAKSVLDEMKATSRGVDWNSTSLSSATDAYMQDVRQRHPELSEKAVGLLGNAFSYWWR